MSDVKAGGAAYRWVPRTLFYLVFYIAVAAGSLLMLPAGVREIAFALSLVGAATNLVETYDFYRQKRRGSPKN